MNKDGMLSADEYVALLSEWMLAWALPRKFWARPELPPAPREIPMMYRETDDWVADVDGETEDMFEWFCKEVLPGFIGKKTVNGSTIEAFSDSGFHETRHIRIRTAENGETVYTAYDHLSIVCGHVVRVDDIVPLVERAHQRRAENMEPPLLPAVYSVLAEKWLRLWDSAPSDARRRDRSKDPTAPFEAHIVSDIIDDTNGLLPTLLHGNGEFTDDELKVDPIRVSRPPLCDKPEVWKYRTAERFWTAMCLTLPGFIVRMSIDDETTVQFKILRVITTDGNITSAQLLLSGDNADTPELDVLVDVDILEVISGGVVPLGLLCADEVTYEHAASRVYLRWAQQMDKLKYYRASGLIETIPKSVENTLMVMAGWGTHHEKEQEAKRARLAQRDSRLRIVYGPDGPVYVAVPKPQLRKRKPPVPAFGHEPARPRTAAAAEPEEVMDSNKNDDDALLLDSLNKWM